jgi:hypothetical protein
MEFYKIYEESRRLKRTIEDIAIKAVFDTTDVEEVRRTVRRRKEIMATEAEGYWSRLRETDGSGFLFLQNLLETEIHRQTIERNTARQAMNSVRGKERGHKKLRDAGIKKPRIRRGVGFFKFMTGLLVERESQKGNSVDDATETN